MTPERSRGRIVVGVDQSEERLEGDFGVDDDLSAAWNMDDHVRAQTTLVSGGRDLLLEVAVGHHAGHLHNPAQLNLPPAPPRLR